ncbi:hypothetical protein EON80_15730 [bacterium]|nr:MAG: hypothetical protein EON80_15730 [bacterium]
MPPSTQEILERLNAAVAQRGLAGPTLAAYRRVWRDTLIRAASAVLDPATLPQAKAEEFYSELTRGRGASCHLQVKAALALLYRVLEAPNPFADCLAPKFRPEAVEIRHLEGGRLAKVLL